MAETLRKRGRYEEAIGEYRKVAQEFPEELRAYVAMMEIALVDLRDDKRAEEIVKGGLAALRDTASRNELLRRHRAVRISVPLAQARAADELERAADPADDQVVGGDDSER